MPMDYRSQIELPIAANYDKSPIRKQEFDDHAQCEQHIQNDGQPNQMLVMTAVGPRMMTPKLNCQCGGSHYGCDCRIVFDENPPPSVDVMIRCYKGGVTPVPNEATVPNCHTWTLNFMTASADFFRLVPIKVYDLALDELVWYSPDLPLECCVPVSFNGVCCVDIRSFHVNDMNIHIAVHNPAGTVGTSLEDTLLKCRWIPIA